MRPATERLARWAVLGLALSGMACQDGGTWVNNQEPETPPWEDDNGVTLGSQGWTTWEEPVVTWEAALRPAEGCEDALAQLRAALIKSMEDQLKANYQDALDQAHAQCWHDYYDYSDCTAYETFADASGWAESSASAEASVSKDGGDDDDEASEYTTTNVQEVEVDEADFLKNDGGFIYILADGALQILDAWPASEAHRISYTPIPGTPTRLFVHQDKAVVYASGNWLGGYGYYDEYGYNNGYGSGAECSYGYDCEFTGDGRALTISVYDISDKAQPRLERRVDFSGSYLASRRIEDIVYNVVYFPELAPHTNWLATWPGGLPYDLCDQAVSDDAIAQAFNQLHDSNLEQLLALDLSGWLPRITDTRYVDGATVVSEDLLADCQGFYIEAARDGSSLLSVVSFDLVEPGDLAATTIVGRPGTVYASKQALFVAARHYQHYGSDWYWEDSADREATTIHSFALAADDTATSYAGSGLVPGRILNQFSLSEHQGYLRLATTQGYLGSPGVSNNLFVLQPQDGALQQVGALTGLAPGEDIRSVRFNGEVGFVVTFKKTDPLFVLDLKDPIAPKVAGELKIPGFSTYMQLIDPQHVMAIGYDADDMGEFAWFDGIMLQIFDVSVLSEPKLMWKEVIGTRGSTSEAATNHYAFTYFGARDLLALPMTVCEGGGDGQYGMMMTFSGLLVYRVTLEEGFQKLGGVSHQAPETEYYDSYGYGYGGACYNWWTESNSLVQRSIFMEDFVYSVAPDQILVADVHDLEHPAASIRLAAP
jgi:uncharacterized secreted protein with C-terminal beta-propeller domain